MKAHRILALIIAIVMICMTGCSTQAANPGTNDNVVTYDADIVVVGGGAIRFSCSGRSCYPHGAKIVVLEKMTCTWWQLGYV